MSLCNEAALLKIWNSSSKRVMKLFFRIFSWGKHGLFLCRIYFVFTSDRYSLSPFFCIFSSLWGNGKKRISSLLIAKKVKEKLLHFKSGVPSEAHLPRVTIFLLHLCYERFCG